jgi:hypothetical protein
MLEGGEQTEELHFQMAHILFRTPGQEFRIASHVLQCLSLIKAKIAEEGVHLESNHIIPIPGDHDMEDVQGDDDEDVDAKPVRLDTRSLRMVLSLAGEKSQKSGAQDMALAYWRAALSLLPEDCWEGQLDSADAPKAEEDLKMEDTNNNDNDNDNDDNNNNNEREPEPLSYQKATLYHETLKLHLQCIEAERWREHFDSAMEICNIVLAKVKNPIDRARVYQHQIEMSVWAYSRADQATAIAMQCMRELGYADDFNFNPTEDEMRVMFAETHKMLLEHIDELQTEPHRMCMDPKISMMMEVLSVAK